MIRGEFKTEDINVPNQLFPSCSMGMPHLWKKINFVIP